MHLFRRDPSWAWATLFIVLVVQQDYMEKVESIITQFIKLYKTKAKL